METINLYEKTFEWLDGEAARYVRLFQLSKTEKERESIKKKIEEIRGRLLAESRTLKTIIDNEL